MKISDEELAFFRNLALSFGDIPKVYIDCEEGFGKEDVPPCILNALDNCGGYEVFAGASKFVIVFDNYNFVMKIPFYGVKEVEDPCCNCEDCDCAVCDYDELKYNSEPYYQRFSRGDYCDTEVCYFEAAKEEGLDSLFAETINLTNYDNDKINVYLQEKCYLSYSMPARHILSFCSKNSRRQAQHIGERYIKSRKWKWNSLFCLDNGWLALLIEKYGYQEVVRIAAMAQHDAKYLFLDLHDGNYGIRVSDGMPVIFDYSGYEESGI